VTYAPDALQRLKTLTVTKQNGVTLTTPLVTTYYYTAVGTIDHVSYPNGTETDNAYDTLNRLTSVTNKNGTTLLSSYIYTLQNDGLRTGLTEQQLEADNTYSTVTKSWTYDALQRMTQETYTTTISPSTNNYTDQYTFDVVGNRLAKTHTVGGQTLSINYTFNSNDQLTAESGSGSSTYSTNYGYDANGSLMSVSRTGSGAETDTYTYDLQSRLASANISRMESGQTVTLAANYTYDDSGPRARNVVTTTVGGGSPTTSTTQYLTDRLNPTGYTQVLEEQVNGASVPNISYLVGLTVLGQTSGSGLTTYLMPDGTGTTRLVVGPTALIQSRYAYDAYGNVLGNTIGIVNPPTTRILYDGEQFDTALQSYYLRARLYDPLTGRLRQFDSSEGLPSAPWSLQKYVFTSDNPINLRDPSGHDAETISTTTTLGLSGWLLVISIVAVQVATWCGIFYLSQTDGTYVEQIPDACSPNQMRVQLQDSQAGKTLHTNGPLPLVAPSSTGVTVRQVQGALTILYQNYRLIAPWFPTSLDPQLAGAIAYVSMRLNRWPAIGGTPAGLIRSLETANFTKGQVQYRVDVDNLRGRNLRSF
jgi:RHS repeat-associated protein